MMARRFVRVIDGRRWSTKMADTLDACLLFVLRAVFDLVTWIAVGALLLLEITPILALIGGTAMLVWWAFMT